MAQVEFLSFLKSDDHVNDIFSVCHDRHSWRRQGTQQHGTVRSRRVRAIEVPAKQHHQHQQRDFIGFFWEGRRRAFLCAFYIFCSISNDMGVWGLLVCLLLYIYISQRDGSFIFRLFAVMRAWLWPSRQNVLM